MSPTPLPPEPQRSREELLGIVRARTTVLRRRRRAMISGSLALVLAVLGGGVALSRSLDSGPSTTVTADQGAVQPAPPSSTTVTSAPETTSSSSPLGAVVTTSTTRLHASPTVTTALPASTTTTALVCRDSTDERCGPFRWDPAPERSELTVQVSLLTKDPVVGTPVQFKVVADDPDTEIDEFCPDYSDGLIGGSCVADYAACPDLGTAYGPWTPPERDPDHVELTPSFSYDKPGTYTVRYTFRTAYPGCRPKGWTNPYADTSSGEVTFTVRPRADGEATTTTSSSTTTTTAPSKGRKES